MLYSKKFFKGLLIFAVAITLLTPTYTDAGIKSRCRKTVKTMKRKVYRVKNKVKNFKRKLTNLESNLSNAKRKVNRMPISSKKKKLLRAVIDASQRTNRLAKYYIKIKTYHIYVAKRVRKAAKPCSPRKWWKRIKKARKVTNRLVNLAKKIPARSRDIVAIAKDVNTISRNATAIVQ